MSEAFFNFFQQGGPFMYPIALIFAVGVAIGLERWLTLSSALSANQRAQLQCFALLKNGDVKAIKQWIDNTKAPVVSVVASALQARLKSASNEDIESKVVERMMEVVPRFEKRTPYLATLANIATLTGLLGTIIGLIAAFTAVAHADPAQKATLLSQSISVAMNTTAFGLITAIPLLLTHAFLQSKTKALIEGFEVAGVKCLNALSVKTQSASAV